MLSSSRRRVIAPPGVATNCLDTGSAMLSDWDASLARQLSGTDAPRAVLPLHDEVGLTGFHSYETVSGRVTDLCEFFTSNGEVWHRSVNSEGTRHATYQRLDPLGSGRLIRGTLPRHVPGTGRPVAGPMAARQPLRRALVPTGTEYSDRGVCRRAACRRSGGHPPTPVFRRVDHSLRSRPRASRRTALRRSPPDALAEQSWRRTAGARAATHAAARESMQRRVALARLSR